MVCAMCHARCAGLGMGGPYGGPIRICPAAPSGPWFGVRDAYMLTVFGFHPHLLMASHPVSGSEYTPVSGAPVGHMLDGPLGIAPGGVPEGLVKARGLVAVVWAKGFAG